MISSSSQTTLAANAFRPFEDRRPADSRPQHRRLPEHTSAAQAARKMLRHWPGQKRPAQPSRRPA